MIDDLVTKGVAEPYRMFTSRAEYRLSLRADNADTRLSQVGIDIGLVQNSRAEVYTKKINKINELNNSLKSLKISPNQAEKFKIKIAKDGVKRSAFDILSRDGVTFDKLRTIWKKIPDATRKEEEQIEISAHYSGYLDKQKADIIAFRKDENLLIPESIDYNKLSGLSNEVKSKFKLIRPRTLGQALRIDGITPAAAYILLSHVKKGSKKLKRA
jgi:tRNA uridine 5-carboxymethylaminomethyl modification enzyme